MQDEPSIPDRIDEELRTEEDFRGDTRRPFVHRFQTQRNKYLFDVNSGQILRVDDATWEIIDDCGVCAEEEIVARHRGRCDAQAASAAYRHVLRLQAEQGFLLARYPQHVGRPITADQIAEALGRGREQLILGVTEQCNLRCRYCLYGEEYPVWRAHSDRQMTWDIARAALDDYFGHSDPEKDRLVSFYGGEPLLAFPVITQCVAYAQEKTRSQVYFHVTTNGTLLRGAVAAYLASKQFRVCVSMDGPQPIHDKNRRYPDGSGTWDTMSQNVCRFLEEHPEYRNNGRLSVNCVLAPRVDTREVDRFFAATGLLPAAVRVKTGGINNLGWIHADGRNGTAHRPAHLDVLHFQFLESLMSGALGRDPERAEWRLTRAMFEQSYRRIHERPVARQSLVQREDLLGPQSMCIPGVQRVYVDCTGRYYPCERVPNTELAQIGDTDTGMDVRGVHQVLERFYQHHHLCTQCWCVVGCAIGCLANTSDGTPTREDARRMQCALHRRFMHVLLVNYCEVLEANPRALSYLENVDRAP